MDNQERRLEKLAKTLLHTPHRPREGQKARVRKPERFVVKDVRVEGDSTPTGIFILAPKATSQT